jgi:16S rRNA (cytosine967-C5)-methyltransferase
MTSRRSDTDAFPRGAATGALGRIHDRALDALAQVLAGAPADRALRGTFAKARDLGSSERAEVTEVVYGVLRSLRRLDDRLDRAARAEKRDLALLDPPMRNRLRVLAHRQAQGATLDDLARVDAYALKRVPGLFARLGAGRLPPARRTPLEDLAVERSLPSWMAARLADAFGLEGAARIAAGLEGRAPFTVRVNRALASREQARDRLAAEARVEATPTPFAPDGLILPHPVDLRPLPLFEDGWVEPQDEGSQLVALATGARPGLSVLDACAGAGGKTLAIAAMMGGKGRLLAVDPEEQKLDELRRRLSRGRVPNAETLATDLEVLPPRLHGAFEVALVDAPCTGTGTLRRSPDLRVRVTEDDIARQVARQLGLLSSASLALAPGGHLVYATCSVLAEENERVVAQLLAVERRLDPAPLAGVLGADLLARLGAAPDAFQLRLGPGPDDRGPDGFYLARLVRRA